MPAVLGLWNVWLRHVSDSRVHGRYFEGLNPANTTIEVSNLIGDHLLEIEAEAIVD